MTPEQIADDICLAPMGSKARMCMLCECFTYEEHSTSQHDEACRYRLIPAAIRSRDDEARKVIEDFYERYRHYSSTDPDLIKAAEAWLDAHPKDKPV